MAARKAKERADAARKLEKTENRWLILNNKLELAMNRKI